jgi:Skp family chaperone for outer membrane proteins
MQLKKVITYVVLGIAVLTGVVLFGNFSRNNTIAAKAPDSTVGYVDIERIQKELPEYIDFMKVAKDKEAEFNFYKSYLNKQLESYNRELTAKAEQEKNGKTTEEKAKIDQKYQEQMQTKLNELNNQLSLKNNEITEYLSKQKDALSEKLKKVIEAVATDMKLTLVLDKSARLYGGVDITQAVLDKAKAGNSDTKTDSKTDTKTNPKTGK